MSEGGICFDPNHFADPVAELRRIRDAGATWHRVVLWPDRDYRDLFKRAHALGLLNAAIVAGESIAGRDYRAVAAEYAARYDGLVDLLLIGNEADQVAHDGLDESFEQTAEDWNALATAFVARWPGVPKAGPGASSGIPERLEDFDLSLLTYLSCHPYGKRPDALSPQLLPPGWGFGPLGAWIDQYAALGKPLVVDEYGAPETELGDAHGEYIGAMTAQLLGDPRVAISMVYCWSDLMTPDRRFGLVDVDGNQKAAYHAFQAATLSASNLPASNTGGTMSDPFHGTIEDWLQHTPTEKLWQPPGAPLIRVRGSGKHRERVAWLDRPEWVLLIEEGGYVYTQDVYPKV